MNKKRNYIKVTKKTPKFIYESNGSYLVEVNSKVDKKVYYVGRYKTIQDALIARDNFIAENKELTNGLLPRGISFNKNLKKYVAWVDVENTRYYLGSFHTLKEAVKERNDLIDSWK